MLFGNGDMNRTCETHGYDSKKHISNEWYCMDSGDEPRIIKMEVLEKKAGSPEKALQLLPIQKLMVPQKQMCI